MEGVAHGGERPGEVADLAEGAGRHRPREVAFRHSAGSRGQHLERFHQPAEHQQREDDGRDTENEAGEQEAELEPPD